MKLNRSKISLGLLAALCFGACLQSCNDSDPEPDVTAGLTRLAEAHAPGAAVKVELYAENALLSGYTSVFISLSDSITGERITNAGIVLYPEMTMSTMSHSCPVENPAPSAVDGIFPGHILFTMPSGEMGYWKLEVNVDLNRRKGKAVMDIDVRPSTPSRVLSFLADNGERYYMGYNFPEKPAIGVNALEVIAFKFKSGAYVPAEELRMKLIPEMPSMDHGSPNNEDPVHTSGGHYSGKVNFTMTGEWRLNLELSEGASSLGTKYFDVVLP